MSGNYGVSAFGAYWDDSRYDNVSKYAGNNSDDTQGSIFGADVDYSSGYDTIFDNFQKTLDEIAAQKAAKEAEQNNNNSGSGSGAGSGTNNDPNAGTGAGSGANNDPNAGGAGNDSNAGGANNDPNAAGAGNDPNAGAQNGEQLAVERKQEVREGFDAEMIAASLHGASQDGIFGWGTDEDVFIKYFDGIDGYKALNDAELYAVAQAYEAKYGKSFEDMVRGEFSFSTEDKYVGRIKNAQEAIVSQNDDGTQKAEFVGDAAQSEELSEEFLKQMATKFYDATVGQWGTDEEAVWQVMNLEPEVLKQVIEYYNNSPYADKKNFEEAIKGDFSWMSGEGKVMEKYNKAMGNE